MNVIGLVANLLHIGLLVVIYLVIPKTVVPERQENIQHWVFVSFSAIFLLLTIVSARDKINIFIIFLIGAIVLSGLIWWVPKYIPEEDQDLASHVLIIASSLFITLISAFYSLTETEIIGIQQTGTYEGIIGGKRRRR